MASVFQRMLQKTLTPMARRVLQRYRPHVVGVTGSVGKTSTVRACGLVLAQMHRVRVSEKNYNNEIGVPLSVLGLQSGGRSAIRWTAKLFAGMRRAYGVNLAYPEFLVLELAADKPGDISYLCDLLQPRTGVVTGISAAHLQNFSTVEAVAEEKGRLVYSLPADGQAILNADDPFTLRLRERTRAKTMTYGFGPHADVVGRDLACAGAQDGAFCGMRCQVEFRGQSVELELPEVLGEHMVYPALAAIAVGLAHGVGLRESCRALRLFTPPPGRMRIIPGIKRTVIIDDSYNSSPAAAQAAVRTLMKVPGHGGRKIAVLGDMLELGGITGRAHRELGGQIARVNPEMLVCVGELARDIARGALQYGYAEGKTFTFPDAAFAGRFLQDRIKTGDVILVKGSQAVRLERVVKELMAEPLRSSELLVRQGPEWR